MGLNKKNAWYSPWRLHSKGTQFDLFKPSLTDNIISIIVLCMSLILIQFLIYIIVH